MAISDDSVVIPAGAVVLGASLAIPAYAQGMSVFLHRSGALRCAAQLPEAMKAVVSRSGGTSVAKNLGG
jgi:hypothetical protein